MPARIYRVLNTTTGDDHLVRAHTQAQAIRHVVADQFRAQVAGQETIVEHLTRGGRPGRFWAPNGWEPRHGA